MKKALLKDTIKEITKNFKRFISILLIVLLGVGFFVGIKSASPDMKETIDQYFDNQNVMDIQILSTLGLTKQDIEKLAEVQGAEKVVGSYFADVLVETEEKDFAIKLEAIQENINTLIVIEGRLPENQKECVVEKSFLLGTNYKIGDSIIIQAEEVQNAKGEKQKLLNEEEVTIVGVVQSPLYLSRDRGATKLGAGKIDYYMYVPIENFAIDFYTVAYITVEGAKELKTYETTYEEKITETKDRIDNISEERKQARYEELYEEANSKIQDAEKELENETKKAQKELEEANQKIKEAKQQLKQGRASLETNKNTTNKKLNEAKKQLEQAQQDLQEKQKTFETEKEKANVQLKQLEKQLEGLEETNPIYMQLKQTIKTIQTELTKNETLLKSAKTELEKQNNSYKQNFENAQNEFKKAEVKLEKAEEEIKTNEKKLEDAQKELDTKIEEAKDEIEKAKQKLEDIKKPDWYILTREQNTGYVSYVQDADRVANIAEVFPLVFFAVAALTSLTSMTRMVEEQRVQIGTLKALGYRKPQIAAKYVIYASLATILGGVIGTITCYKTLPAIILGMYDMMYTIPITVFKFNRQYAIIRNNSSHCLHSWSNYLFM